jgi:hypothetical protein
MGDAAATVTPSPLPAAATEAEVRERQVDEDIRKIQFANDMDLLMTRFSRVPSRNIRQTLNGKTIRELTTNDPNGRSAEEMFNVVFVNEIKYQRECEEEVRLQEKEDAEREEQERHVHAILTDAGEEISQYLIQMFQSARRYPVISRRLGGSPDHVTQSLVVDGKKYVLAIVPADVAEKHDFPLICPPVRDIKRARLERDLPRASSSSAQLPPSPASPPFEPPRE